MTFVVSEACVGVKDAACVAVCPVDCISSTDADHLYFINPDECIHCGVCVPHCPVNAIFAEDEVPEEQKVWISANYEYFTTKHETFYAKFGDLVASAMERYRPRNYAQPASYDW